MSEGKIIAGKGLSKSYNGLRVLKAVDIEVAPSEVLAIVGASGAGKSTLLHILGLLDTPDEGHLTLSGEDVLRIRGKARARFINRHIGFVFQFHNLLYEFNALENVCMPGFLGRTPPQEVRERGKELLQMLGLAERMKHHPSQLSGGEQQRVAVARALLNQPSVVFADEPSGNLDSKNAQDLHRLFFDLRKKTGQTFVIVTHNEQLAQLADRILTMQDGEVIPNPETYSP